MPNVPKILGPGKGFDVANLDVFILNAVGSNTALGDIVGLNIVATGIFVSFRDPVAVHFRGFSVIGVALENIANGAYGRVRLRGQCLAYTLSTGAATAIAAGSPLFAKVGSVLDVDTPAAAPRKIIALGLEASSGAASSAKALRNVLLDGIDGFGTYWLS